jgi:serine/threonine-protein kinase
VKVLDFGIARLRELTSVSKATKTGSTMGTPAFMAYEQARGLWDEVDARTDLWAVGAIMFALLSGRCVHEGRTTQEVLLGAMTKPAPPITSVVPGVSPAVAQLVDRALAQDKAKRWPDAARMQERVHGAYHDRFKVAITTAPKLTVPETVPNRTLPSSNVPVPFRSRTTGQPVANSGIQNHPLPVLPLAIGGGVLAGGALLVVTIVVVSAMRQPKHETTGSASTTTRASASTVPPPTASASASVPLAIAPTDLPRSDTSAAPKPTSKPAATAAPSAAPTSTKPNCNPPFVVDPNSGKKTWKVECLP